MNEWMVEWQPMHLFSCKCSKTNNFSLLFCGKFWPPLILWPQSMHEHAYTHGGTHHVIIMWHLSAGALTDSPTFGPNLNEFVKRFDSSKTKGQGTHAHDGHMRVTWLLSGPIWLKNIYFAYLVVLKAVAKAERVWSNYVFYTGSSSEEEAINKTIQKLVSSAK